MHAQATELLIGLPRVFESLASKHEAFSVLHAATPGIAALPAHLRKWAALLRDIVHQLEKYELDIPKLEQDIADWAQIMVEHFGLEKLQDHGLTCLQHPPKKGYEHCLRDHVIDQIREHGTLLLFSSWFLESNHKCVKEVLRNHCSWGGGGEHAGGFTAPAIQVLRYVSNMNSCCKACGGGLMRD